MSNGFTYVDVVVAYKLLPSSVSTVSLDFVQYEFTALVGPFNLTLSSGFYGSGTPFVWHKLPANPNTSIVWDGTSSLLLEFSFK